MSQTQNNAAHMNPPDQSLEEVISAWEITVHFSFPVSFKSIVGTN